MKDMQVRDKFAKDELALRETIQRDLTDTRGYVRDFRLYTAYCTAEEKEVGEQSLLHYLHYSLTEQKVKKNTFNRRYFAIKKMLELQGIELSEAHRPVVIRLRRQFASAEHATQARVEGKSAVNSNELLEHIRGLADARAKAILFTQFYTGNRPSEMVLLKVGDFYLNNREVDVYLKKQRMYKAKNLPRECVDAIRDYVRLFDLTAEDFFVGQVHKTGSYISRSISLTAYYNLLQKWSGYSAYNYRKSLVSHMYKNGASVEVIQQQTGHTNTQTITQHYLQVDKESVNKYL